MDEKMLFTVKTTMEKEDYRKFLYVATFKKTPIIIPMILFMAAIGSAVIAFDKGSFNIVTFLVTWVIMTAFIFGIICFKVEDRNKKRIRTDKVGAFGTYQTVIFYENCIVTFNEKIEGKSKIRYDQLYRVLESKDYLIFYYNENMASLIRKKDIEEDDRTKIIELLQRKLGNIFKSI
ncbi:amino acid permease [Clostridium tetanomorphum]|uniref:YcxB family protein n=1 Tax=Clostridium tetanomorphum TaxID=1553 RepID=A0A923J0X3_CLOTT|nr:YcxB family protein [Clostridium tetanomorphum]KAJ53014.1 membrane associated protein [Clostridium tetanomorphum DSM 665]MBC2398547.1 YcxB family protein [Clostridium tetanomorphum]MBP1864957.1 amino acid permease [Clostridium tetanomorphum]NRS83163.1 amino acid permease [Clostridium tetanomorphum]NRZ98736.1 amino acid permease [Clostridium tetanomorphum]